MRRGEGFPSSSTLSSKLLQAATWIHLLSLFESFWIVRGWMLRPDCEGDHSMRCLVCWLLRFSEKHSESGLLFVKTNWINLNVLVPPGCRFQWKTWFGHRSASSPWPSSPWCNVMDIYLHQYMYILSKMLFIQTGKDIQTWLIFKPCGLHWEQGGLQWPEKHQGEILFLTLSTSFWNI